MRSLGTGVLPGLRPSTIVDSFGSAAVLNSAAPPTISGDDGRATVFTTNVRLELAPIGTRLLPYVVGGGGIANIKHKFAVLKQHCDDLGRDYNTIRRTTLIDDCAIAETEEQAIAKLTPAQRSDLDELRRTQLIGTPALIRQRLAEYEEAGVQEIIIRVVDATQLESIRLFARECM